MNDQPHAEALTLSVRTNTPTRSLTIEATYELWQWRRVPQAA